MFLLTMVLRKLTSLYSLIMATVCIFQVTVDARRNWNPVCSEKLLYGHSVCHHLSAVLYELESRTQYIREFETMHARMELLEKNANARAIESIEQNINARTEFLKQNINARMKSIEQNTNARMESLEGSLNRRMKSLEQNMNARMEWFETNRYEIVGSFKGNVNARMELLEKNANARMDRLAEKMNTRMKSLDEKMNAVMELQMQPSNVIPGPKMLASLNQTWHAIGNKMQNVTFLEESLDMQKLVNSKFKIIEESMNRDRSNTKKLKERLDSVEFELSNLLNSNLSSQMSEKIGSFRKDLKNINETIQDNINPEKSRQSLLEMNSEQLQDLENVKAQVGFLRIANSVSQRGLEELRNKIKNVENVLERGQYHRKETGDSDQDDSSKKDGSADKPYFSSRGLGSSDKPEVHSEDGSADKPSVRSEEIGSSDKPHDYSEEDGSADKPSLRDEELGSSDKPHDYSEEIGSSDKPHDYSEEDGSDDKPSLRNEELGSSDKPDDYSEEDGSAELPIYF